MGDSSRKPRVGGSQEHIFIQLDTANDSSIFKIITST